MTDAAFSSDFYAIRNARDTATRNRRIRDAHRNGATLDQLRRATNLAASTLAKVLR